ncbi:hypothetical protein [Pontibacter sp. H249]|uniref:hypothetical protein n=1 Tax=Pontibacter sp. H249 TaxID=3133420 RepID=UPI0030C06970
MKPVFAAVAMLLLLTLTIMGVKDFTACDQEERAKAGVEWRNNPNLVPQQVSTAS